MSNISIFKFEESFTIRTVVKDVARSRLDIVLTNDHESCETITFLIQCATNWKTSRRRVGNRALGSIATLGL